MSVQLVERKFTAWFPVRETDGNETILTSELGFTRDMAIDHVHKAEVQCAGWSNGNPVKRYAQFAVSIVEMR